MKLKDWTIKRRGKRITSASYVIENENATNEIKDQDLPDEFGVTLVKAVNSLHKQIVESNGAEGSFTCHNMGNFYGNTMKITITRKQC